MNKLKLPTFALFLSLSLYGCSTAEQSQLLGAAVEILGQTALGTGPLSQNEAGLGLKQALAIGIKKGASSVSQKNGFLNNIDIKIPFPEEAKLIQSTLNRIGMNSLTDKVTTSLNRAAEDAAKEAIPIFTQAITQMSFQDALQILSGTENAATSYLERTTRELLAAKFQPRISESLAKVGATKYWGDVVGQYNRVPLMKPVNTDLKSYVTNQALDGLFHMVAKEELNIRKNPQARTTELLKRVFGQ